MVDIAALMSAASSSGGGIGSLGARSSGLPDILAQYEIGATAARIAGLMTLPELHVHTVRLESLAHLAAAYCSDTSLRKPRRKQLLRWLKDNLASVAWMEDPVEDVFISNSITGLGNHRLFEGIWEKADFNTQCVLDVIHLIPPNIGGNQLRYHIGALLRLSEAVAERSKLARYVMGGGNPKGEVPVPVDDRLKNLSRRVIFTQSELAELSIELEALRPFILRNREQTLADQFGSSSLERCPLLLCGDRIVVALPTAISMAVRRLFLEHGHANSVLDRHQNALRVRQIDHLHSSMTHFKATTIRSVGSIAKPARPPLDEFTYRFDEGGYAHVVLLHDDLEELRREGFGAPKIFPEPEEKALQDYLEGFAQQVAAQPDYQAGMTLVIIGGLGRGLAARLGMFPDNWHVIVMGLADFHLLSHLQKASLLLLWKMKRQVADAAQHGIRLSNPNGDLNLLAFWRNQGWAFLPDPVPYPHGQAIFSVPTDAVAKLRHELRRGYDNHAAQMPNGIHIPVHRRSHQYWFQAPENEPTYGSSEHARNGELVGIAEAGKRAWWLNIHRCRELSDNDLPIRLWDAALNWLGRLAPRIDPLIPGERDVTITLNVDALDGVELTPGQLRALQPAEPTFSVKGAYHIEVTLPLGWNALLHQSTNIAEKSLLTACAQGVAVTRGLAWSGTLQAVVDAVFSDPGARFMHMFEASEYRDYTREFHPVRARFLPPQDQQWSRLGAAFLTGELKGPTKLEGKQKCVKFLNELVDGYWTRIRTALRQFDRLSIVRRSISRIESNSLDVRTWIMSARALLGLHTPDEALRVSQEQEIERNQAAIAYRVAIEMANCEAPATGGKLIGDAAFDSIVSDIHELTNAAYHSDAIRHGYAKSTIDVPANGRLILDERFYEDVLSPYSVDFFTAQFQHAADTYETLLRPAADTEDDEPTVVTPGWDAAFTSQYGMSTSKVAKIVRAIQSEALKEKQTILVRSRTQLEAVALEASDESLESVQKLLDALTLPARARWDEKSPAGFRARDWYPWHFQRRLSAVSRPFIQIEGETVMFSPAMLEDSFKYLGLNAHSGDLPSDFFTSTTMSAWIGARVAARGEKFNDQVYARARELGLQARARVLMSELGVPSSSRDLRQSDIDVVAWSSVTKTIYLIECKHLKQAKTIGDIADQLDDFRRDADAAGKNNLAKHEERVSWLDKNRAELARISSIPATAMKLCPLIVTNRKVPMQFAASLPGITKEIASYGQLEQWLK